MRDVEDFSVNGKTRAVILGKGPSFERYEGDNDPETLVVGINQAAKVVPVDIMIAAHIEPIEEVLEEAKPPVIFTPYFPLYGWDTHHDKAAAQYECLNFDDVYLYNAHWCANRISGSEIVNSFGTTAHHIVQILARHGIKEFIFYGVDGGRKAYGKKYYADGFEHDSKQYFQQGKLPADFDAFWTPYFQMRRKHGLTYTFA